MRASRWRALALGMTAAVLVGSFLPQEELPGPDLASFDKLLHVVAYALVSFAWRASGIGIGGTVLVVLALALVTEGGQALLPTGRAADLADAVADVVGLVVGLGAHAFWASRRAAGAR